MPKRQEATRNPSATDRPLPFEPLIKHETQNQEGVCSHIKVDEATVVNRPVDNTEGSQTDNPQTRHHHKPLVDRRQTPPSFPKIAHNHHIYNATYVLILLTRSNRPLFINAFHQFRRPALGAARLADRRFFCNFARNYILINQLCHLIISYRKP